MAQFKQDQKIISLTINYCTFSFSNLRSYNGPLGGAGLCISIKKHLEKTLRTFPFLRVGSSLAHVVKKNASEHV